MYYNPCTFLQANIIPPKTAIVVSIFSNRGQIKQYSTLFKSCNFQNGVAIPVATVAIFVAIKLQLIAIPIKYSCDKNMCVKDWSEISWMKKLLKKVIIVLARNSK